MKTIKELMFPDNVNVALVAFRVAKTLGYSTKTLAFNDVADVADFRAIIKP